MNRIPPGPYGEAIARGLDLTKRHAHLYGNVRFVCGVDPVFAGVHSYAGMGYDVSPHCCYPWNLIGPRDVREQPTIVLPTIQCARPHHVVHELGHVIHYRLGFDHVAVPVTEYAATNKWEAFAVAYEATHFWFGDQGALERDRATQDLFERMAA